ncbi:hypothetical protein Rhopal_004964-T1 [Rhodotorula paludigena]|uniref:Uncharacterized protein n=1 Tax=Rhodotorula paludigena TaxID=86838 RepID=A0AAV5GRQ9_9BASI|nr:hypothetical protein Rhopal_004964-T1 [Rhodotorula paludigena]
MPPQWLYSVAVLTSLLYLHYNALVIGRRRFLTDDGLSATASAGAPPGVDRASLICNFADAGSAERGIREAEAQHNIDVPASRRSSAYSAAGSQRDGGGWRSMGFGRRPKSSTGAAIMVTVEQEQVCDGDTCARWYAQQEDEDEIAPDRRV